MNFSIETHSLYNRSIRHANIGRIPLFCCDCNIVCRYSFNSTQEKSKESEALVWPQRTGTFLVHLFDLHFGERQMKNLEQRYYLAGLEYQAGWRLHSLKTQSLIFLLVEEVSARSSI